MKKCNRILAVFLLVCILCSLTTWALAATFTDVPSHHWASAEIGKAAEMGLVTGSGGKFRPNDPVKRSEFVMMLWRMAGSPQAGTKAAFTDVKAADWYAEAVAWASEQGYVTGANGKFDPNGPITREQAMAILFRYSGGQPGGELLLGGIYNSHFTDSGKIASWAKPAVWWAVYKGIVGGVTADTIQPQGTATRAQIAVIFLRYLEKYS